MGTKGNTPLHRHDRQASPGKGRTRPSGFGHHGSQGATKREETNAGTRAKGCSSAMLSSKKNTTQGNFTVAAATATASKQSTCITTIILYTNVPPETPIKATI